MPKAWQMRQNIFQNVHKEEISVGLSSLVAVCSPGGGEEGFLLAQHCKHRADQEVFHLLVQSDLAWPLFEAISYTATDGSVVYSPALISAAMNFQEYGEFC